MKTMKKINILLICLMAISLTSCDDFLDVRPKAEKLERDLFKNAQGFEDAIYGVYGSLASTSIYGKDMLWGVPEVLAQNLHCYGNQELDALAEYDYTSNDGLRQRFASIWTQTYKSIGYANNILEQLNDWSPATLPLFNYYKGEMLGIRAMLHFDMLRLYAPTNESATGIPYVTTYSYDVKPFRKVGEVYDLILKDLQEAEQLLADDEQTIVYPHNNENYNKFNNYRETHFNLYAVRALLARVYWMRGDMVNAAKYATNVIDSQKFPLVDVTEVQDYLAGVLSPKETIFGIYSNSYLETSRTFLYDNNSYRSYNTYDNTSGSNHLEPWQTVYSMDVAGTVQDYRRNHFKVQTASSAKFLKLVDYYTIEGTSRNTTEELISGVTLFHTSELYLIAAEALLQTNYQRALAYFNAEITSRGLTALQQNETLTEDRIYNEYRKEMFGEGQMWFNMKRLNKDIVSNAEAKTITANDEIYVIPIPAEEYEYRNE